MKIHQLLKYLLVAMLSTALITGCSSFAPEAAPIVEEDASPDLPTLVAATGIVTPAQWARLSMTTAGIVEEVLAQEGETVQQGEILVRLKGQEDLQAAVSTANLELVSAQKALDDLNKNAQTSKTQTLEQIALYAQQLRDAQYQLDNFTVPTNQDNMEPMQGLGHDGNLPGPGTHRL